MGQLYLSFDATSPEKIWPGTKWTQVTGYFLRAANDTQAGGSDTKTLSVANMPSHTHAGPSHTHGAGTLAAASGGGHWHKLVSGINTFISLYRVDVSASSSGNWFGAFDGLSETSDRPSGSYRTIKTAPDGAHGHSVTGATAAGGTGATGSAGDGQAFDNRPAYQDVYVWRRTA